MTAIVLSIVLLGLAAATAGAHVRAGHTVRGKARGATAAVAHRRLEALAAAGHPTAPARHGGGRHARGWVGSQLLNPRTDDWEPAVAADPHAPYVYMLTTRFGAGKTCPGNCPTPYIVLTVSSDGGHTWSAQRPLCVCEGASEQYDPTIEVVPNTGAVYAAFLNGAGNNPFSTVFIKSTDHGQSWSKPVKVYGNVAWTDKDEVTMDSSGRDVYVSWNGPTNGDLYVGVSHDFGVTWTQHRLTHSRRYYYAYDARTLRDGTVVFAQSSLVYKGNGVTGQVWHHLVVSHDNGATWSNTVVAKVPVGQACVAAGCPSDFYIGQASVAPVQRRHLVFAYEGPNRTGGPQRVYVVRTNDFGRRWSTPMALSVQGEDATGPRLASTGRGGDVRIWYMQTSGHDNPDAWNVWFRESRNGGRSWSAPVRLDDAPPGAAGYIYAHGFGEIYGDYGEAAVTSTGKTIAVWGEAYSYNGPGGTWFNLQR